MYESSSFPTSSPTLVFTCFVFGYSHPSRSRPSRHLLFVFVRTHSGKCDRNLAQTSLNKQNKHKVGGWAAGFIVSSNWKVQPSWIWVLTWCLQSTLTSFSEQCSLEVALVLQQFQEFAFCLFSKLAECISLPGLLVSELRHSLVLVGHVIFPGSYFPPWTQMLPSKEGAEMLAGRRGLSALLYSKPHTLLVVHVVHPAMGVESTVLWDRNVLVLPWWTLPAWCPLG